MSLIDIENTYFFKRKIFVMMVLLSKYDLINLASYHPQLLTVRSNVDLQIYGLYARTYLKSIIIITFIIRRQKLRMGL